MIFLGFRSTAILMLRIESSDLQDMGTFPLRWRWTDATWNLLPAEDLACIRPLQPPKAIELDEKLRELLKPVRPRITGETCDSLCSIVKTPGSSSFDTSGQMLPTQDWLRTILPADDGDVFVTWFADTAAVVRLSVFIQYWDDFCYPFTYDVVVIPPSAKWVLYYFHDEQFFFWKR
jgi:hypothetical protein